MALKDILNFFSPKDKTFFPLFDQATHKLTKLSEFLHEAANATKNDRDIYFTKIGANDPSFNLRAETSIVFRKTKQSPIFLSVLEMHGSYDTRNEFSYDTYSKVKEIIVLQQDDKTTVFKIVLNNTTLLFAIANNDFDEKAKHNVTVSSENIQWTGPYHFKKMAN